MIVIDWPPDVHLIVLWGYMAVSIIMTICLIGGLVKIEIDDRRWDRQWAKNHPWLK